MCGSASIYMESPNKRGKLRDNTAGKLVSGGAALIALFAGVLAHVDPLACVGRAALAFLLGGIGYQVWYVLVTSQTSTNRLIIGATGLTRSEESDSKAA